MNKFHAAFYTESLKVIKSKIFIVTVCLFAFIPLMMGLMIYIVRHPELAGKLGILSAKANLFGTTDGKGFLDLVNQLVATVGLIGCGFVTAWVFGSEHIEKTIKDILALPVSRSYIVYAKFLVVVIWCLILMMVLFVTSAILGYLANLEGWNNSLIINGFLKFMITGLMVISLSTPVAFIAGYGRGLIAPLGFVIVSLILSQFIALSGLGAFFPWAVPGLFTVVGDVPGMYLLPVSYFLVIITFAVGLAATLYWWNNADHF